MKKQPEITDVTKETFITAFFQLAEIKNIYSITVREIANLAGYNRTTFYRYFQDVFALIECAEDDYINDVLSSVIPAMGENRALNDAFFRILMSKFKEHRERLSVLLCDQNRARFIRHIQERTLHEMNSPVADTPKNKIVMNIYFTGIFSAMASQIQNPKTIDDEELFGIIQRLFKNWFWPEIKNQVGSADRRNEFSNTL